MLRAVIFDVDGVLVDSKDAVVELYKDLLTTAGYPEPSRKEVLKHFHQPIMTALPSIIDTSDPTELSRIKNLLDAPGFRKESISKLFKFPDKLEETLEHLKRHYKIAVVTSRLRVGMEHIYTVRQIEHLFDAVVTYEDYSNPKPDPEPLFVALKRLNVKPTEAIYIGDSDTDIEAAQAAGMRSIHLSDTPHTDATAVAKEFDELIGAINSLL